MITRTAVVLLFSLGFFEQARADGPRPEGGVVSLNKWEQPDFERMAHGSGDRYYVVEVPLARPWTSPPLVMASLSAIDGDNSANLRIAVGVGRVGTHSFELRVRTWAETRIWGVAVSWIALDAPGVTQPTLAMPTVGVAAPREGRVLSPPPPNPPAHRPAARCGKHETWGCHPITTGVAPPYGQENPSVCGCVPDCAPGLNLFTRPLEGTWPDGSPRGAFSCTTSLPP